MDLTLQWLPTTDPDDYAWRCQVEYQLDGGRVQLDASDVDRIEFERADPVRAFPSWPGKRHYDGFQWMDALGRAIGFESLTERACLIELGRMPAVTGVASQPLTISWSAGRANRTHTPDYFVRLDDGSAVLIDVKTASQLLKEDVRAQFDLTLRFCQARGWSYVVFDGGSKVRAANLRFLYQYRSAGRAVAPPKLPRGGLTLAEITDVLGGEPDNYAHCYGMLWRNQLHIDYEAPLTLRSRVYEGSSRGN